MHIYFLSSYISTVGPRFSESPLSEPLIIQTLLNQARAGLRPVRVWFLIIVSVRTSVCVFVCVFVCLCVRPPPRLLITSGVIWHDIDPIRLVKQVLQLFMATVIVIVNGHGLGIGMRHTH